MSIQLSEIFFFAGRLLSAIGILILFLLSAYGWGSTLLRLVRLKAGGLGENSLYSMILGTGILGHFILIFGLLKLLYPLTGYILLSVGGILCLLSVWVQRSTFQDRLLSFEFPRRISWFHAALVLFILINLGYSLLANTLLPPLSSDEVAYHMAAPKIYVAQQSLAYIDTIPHTNWPFEIEMIFTLGLLVGSESLAHLVTWAALIFSCILLAVYGKKYFNTSTGLVAAAVFSSLPVVTTLAGSGLIEVPLTMYILLAALALIEWLSSGNSSYLVLSAIAGGLAASTKLNATVFPVILGVCVLIQAVAVRKYSIRKAIGYFSLYGGLAFIIVLPWYLKAWIQTGNPFWPYLWNILGGKNWDALGSQYFFGFIQSPNMPLNLGSWVTGLWRIVADPSRYGSYRFDLNWLLVALIPLAVIAYIFYKKQNRPIFLWLGILSLIFYTNWFLQTHQTRFLMPFAGEFCLFLAVGVTWLVELRGGAWKALFSIAFIAGLLLVSWPVNSTDRAQLVSDWPYLSGQVTRNQLLESRNQGYKVFEYIDANLPKDANLWLALYEVRGYYLDQPYSWANPLSQRAVKMEQFEDAAQLAVELRARGIRYIMLQTWTIDKYSSVQYGEEYAALIRALVSQQAQLVYEDSGEQLFQLLPSP